MPLTRRLFLGAALAAPALSAISARAEDAAKPIRKIKLGLIGCGGRGSGAASQNGSAAAVK